MALSRAVYSSVIVTSRVFHCCQYVNCILSLEKCQDNSDNPSCSEVYHHYQRIIFGFENCLWFNTKKFRQLVVYRFTSRSLLSSRIKRTIRYIMKFHRMKTEIPTCVTVYQFILTTDEKPTVVYPIPDEISIGYYIWDRIYYSWRHIPGSHLG